MNIKLVTKHLFERFWGGGEVVAKTVEQPDQIPCFKLGCKKMKYNEQAKDRYTGTKEELDLN